MVVRQFESASSSTQKHKTMECLIYQTSFNGDKFSIYSDDSCFYLEHYGWTSGIYTMYESNSYFSLLRLLVNLKNTQQ